MKEQNPGGLSEDFHYFTTSIVSLVTGLSFFKVLNSSLQIYANKKLLKDLQKSPIKSPDSKFEKGEKCIIKGNVQISQRQNEKIEAIGENKKKEEYVLHLRYLESMYSNEEFDGRKNYWINLQEIAGSSQINFQKDFYLSLNKSKILVQNYDQINYGPALEINKWNHQRRSLNFSQKINILILSYLRGIGTLVVNDKRPTFLRGIEVGTREVQAGIKVGSSMMALGTITAQTEGGKHFILEPHLFFKQRLSFVVNLQDIIKSLEEKRNLWALIMVLGSIYLGRRAYKYHKKYNLRQWLKRMLNI